MGEVGVLGDAERVDIAAAAVAFYAAEVRVGVGEDDLDAAAAHARARARALAVIVVPAGDVFYHEIVLVVVVRGGTAGHVRILLSRPDHVVALALLVEGIGPVVPVFAERLVAAVFHGPERGVQGAQSSTAAQLPLMFSRRMNS